MYKDKSIGACTRWHVALWAACLALALAVIPVTAEEEGDGEAPTLESINKALAEKWSGLKSASGTLDIDAQIPGAGDNVMHVVGSGATASLKQDDSVMSRIEISVKMAESKSDMELASAVAVYDGNEAAVRYKLLGSEKYMSVSPGSIGSGGDLTLNLLKKHFDLLACADEKIYDKDVYVLEGTPKESGGIPVAKVRIYFDQECGLPIQLEAYDNTNKVLLTAKQTDIKTNEEMSADMFKLPSPPPPPTKPAAPSSGEGDSTDAQDTAE